jgi:hypothetical protein
MDCVTCLEIHGVGCEGTHQDDAGKWVCLFCLDGEICPIQAKRLRDARKKTPDETPPAASDVNSEKPASEQKSEVTTMKTPEPDSTSTLKKICAKPECGRELSPENTCGRCRAHVRWREHSSSGSHGSATKANGNGHAAAPAKDSKGDLLPPNLAAARVDHLIANLTAADKARVALAWLRGQV